MNGSRAFFAGVFGAAIMSLLLAIARVWGMEANPSLLLGSMITRLMDSSTWFLGFLLHLAIGGVFGLIYGQIFERWLHRASASGGAAIGFIHAIIAGLLVGLAPVVHPLMPQTLAAPGVFFTNLGTAAVIAFIVLHVLYGMLVGSLYETRTVHISSVHIHQRHV